jgi:hypothetical protein
MPYVETSVISAVQIYNFCWLKIVWSCEDKKLNACCATAVKREINPVGFDGASEGMGRAFEATKRCALGLKRIASK